MMLIPEHPRAPIGRMLRFSHILPPTNLFSEIRRTKRQYPYNQVVQYCIHRSSLWASICANACLPFYPPAKGNHQHNYPTSALLLTCTAIIACSGKAVERTEERGGWLFLGIESVTEWLTGRLAFP
jgi:hypothetical protein